MPTAHCILSSPAATNQGLQASSNHMCVCYICLTLPYAATKPPRNDRACRDKKGQSPPRLLCSIHTQTPPACLASWRYQLAAQKLLLSQGQMCNTQVPSYVVAAAEHTTAAAINECCSEGKETHTHRDTQPPHDRPPFTHTRQHTSTTCNDDAASDFDTSCNTGGALKESTRHLDTSRASNPHHTARGANNHNQHESAAGFHSIPCTHTRCCSILQCTASTHALLRDPPD